MQECCRGNLFPGCQQHWTILLSLNQPAIRCNIAEQYCWQPGTKLLPPLPQYCCILFLTEFDFSRVRIHRKIYTTCSGLWKQDWTMFCCPCTLFNLVNNIIEHCYTWLRADSGSRMVNNIVDNVKQFWQQNIIVQSCSHQPWTGCLLVAAYTGRKSLYFSSPFLSKLLDSRQNSAG